MAVICNLSRVLVCTALLGTACAPKAGVPATAANVASVTLPASDGRARAYPALLGDAKYTVLIFFTAHCPVVRAHDARLKELSGAFAAQGVQFFFVDSESDASIDTDTAALRERGYGFPALRDEKGALARAFGAEYATFTVVVDGQGKALYRGGIDSDRTHLQEDAKPYLRRALEDITAGRAVRDAETKAMGCALNLG